MGVRTIQLFDGTAQVAKYLQVERKSAVRLECSIEMNKGNYLLL